MDPPRATDKIRSGSGGGGGGAPKSLHHLCHTILGPNCREELVQQHYHSSLQMLSLSSATRTKQTLSADFNVAEKIKKRMVSKVNFTFNILINKDSNSFQVREGRASEAVHFSQLLQRLKETRVLKNPTALLTLFIELSEPKISPAAPQQKYHKFVHGDHLQTNGGGGVQSPRILLRRQEGSVARVALHIPGD